MSRITKRELELSVERLNAESKRCGEWYGVEYYNGACRLTGARGSINIMPLLGTKKECYYIVHSILNVLYQESIA
jgi:hypothetical protein